MAAVDPPTETVAWGPYVDPANWDRHAPCQCGCPPCPTWTQVEAPLAILVTDNGKCWSAGAERGGGGLLPVVGGVTLPFCVSFMATRASPFTVYSQDATPIMVGGIGYPVVQVLDGQMCICFDGVNWVATGDAVGRNDN